MIQNHHDSNCNSTEPRPIKHDIVSDNSLNLRSDEKRQLNDESSYTTLQLSSQTELLRRFIADAEEQLFYDVMNSPLDIFSSEAHSGYEQLGELKNTETLPLTPENFPNSVVANEYSCSSNQTNKDPAMTDLTYNSDSSNPPHDNIKQEEFIIPSDEPYSYLQGLNSDNLMQFSQQSAIQELMLKEQLGAKPNLDMLPNFDEHDIGGYKFDIQVGDFRKGRRTWVYSPTRKKLYIRMNELFTLDVCYVPKLPLQQLRVRILICFKHEVSEPVLRCQNHLSKDADPEQARRESLLRCENPSAEHCGTAEGKSIHDRYSVLIPLGLCAMPKNDSSIGQPIAIKFTCQNSCIGRKETSIIFILEGMSGEILSQRVMDVKICTCPIRDHKADKRDSPVVQKRKSNEAVKSRPAKEIKLEDERRTISLDAPGDEDTCSDWENSDSGISPAQDTGLQLMPSGKYRLSLELDKDMMYEAVTAIKGHLACRILSEPRKSKHDNKMFRKLKRYSEKLQRT
ncbi:cellular tumor antigen p53 [Eurosta solidaginis]|uniref:cellular tumor antigen p53 n=1 Tax=Eurosta solidaginis TaxID=178769 RepID=UPI003531126A